MTAVRYFLVLLALLLPASAATGREEIRTFSSAVTVNADASVDVIETIDVNAEGNQIRRGIYRDIPVVMIDDEGNRIRPGLEVTGVQRDGRDEPWRTERMGEFIRIWIGDADRLLDRRVHRYQISYTMTRMGRFFADYDEIYWNATGNYWNFPILEAVASVRLPDGVEAIEANGYTGRVGSTEQAVTISEAQDGRTVFRVTRPLASGEGLTVSVTFPKGVMQPPAGATGLGYWFLDRQDVFVPMALALLVLGYFSLAWYRVGRDPARGTIIPLFHPPRDFSPALVHYVHHYGWQMNGWTALTAAAFSLGVKGLLTIDNRDKTLSLSVTGKQPSGELPPGEQVLFNYVSHKGTVTVDKKTGPELEKKRGEFVAAITSENRDVWFLHNFGYTVLGLLLAAAALGIMVWLGYLEIFWMIGGLVVGIFGALSLSIVRAIWKGNIFQTAMVVLWVMVFGGNVIGGFGVLWTGLVVSTAVIAAVSIAATTVVFGILMRAPTVQGRQVMDEIEGLKLYLETAEKDRMNMVDEPPMTVERFERLLPYAIALGVEKPWSEHFEAELARTAANDANRGSYQPSWYHGRAGSFSPGKIAGAVAGAATGMSAAMVAAQPVSSSSSGGGGGGFSGGGGGGGGGGGW